MAVNLSPVGGVAAQFFDNSGNVLTGGKIYTYSAGTTTPATTFTTSAGTIAWSNPIILDASGRVSGSGEVWLTDNIAYKFVLKDSNDVLIATYDNITGINSNFVNFVSETEIQTATAGQTVFTLTTMQYQPGTNNLLVFVDGVNQYEGGGYSFVETNSTTVTFTSGLHVGAEVKFTTATPINTLTADAATTAYDPPFPNSVITNVQDKLAQYISIKDFGAVGDGVTDDTTAIQNAINYSSSIGGVIVLVPYGTYKVSELTFDNCSNVILQGETQGYTYGNAKSTSILQCETGTWAIRFPETGSYCGIQDLAIQSNGEVNTTSPYLITVPGVEYGVLIETSNTTMRRVTVYGFQYGCTIAAGGNSNIFDECGFVWNTRVGFAVTQGGSAAYAVYHPNLAYTGTIADSTVYTMRNCNLRRNAWGIVLRAGSGTFHNTLCESNIFGGLLEWAGSVDNQSGGGGNFYDCYFESNWQSFDPASITWFDSAVQDNNYLKNTVSTYITLVDNSNNALSDFGYQITMGSETAGTVDYGPSYQLFSKTAMVVAGYQKALFLKQGYKNHFDYLSAPGGTTPANNVRLGQTAGSFYANYTQFYQPNVTLPADFSNRGYAFESSAYDGGGLIMTQGYFRGLAGNVIYPATPLPVTLTGTSYNAAAYPEQSSFIVNASGTFSIAFRPANETSYSGGGGRWLYIKNISGYTVSSSTSNIVPINSATPGTAILPATAGSWAILQSDGSNWVIMAKG